MLNLGIILNPLFSTTTIVTHHIATSPVYLATSPVHLAMLPSPPSSMAATAHDLNNTPLLGHVTSPTSLIDNCTQ